MRWSASALNCDVISSALDRIFSSSTRRRRGNQFEESILKITVALEGYAEACMQAVFDNRVGYNEGIMPENLHRSLPAFFEEGLTDYDLQFLNRQLATEVLAFRDAVVIENDVMKQDTNATLSSSWITCSEQGAKLGYRAAILANNVRKTHRLLDGKTDWECRDRLSIEMQRIEEEEAAWQSSRIKNESEP